MPKEPKKRKERKTLTDLTLQGLKPKGASYDVMDAQVPGFGVRVLAGGSITFVFVARYPGFGNPARRAIGQYVPTDSATMKGALDRYKALPEAERGELTFDQYLLREYGPTTLAAAREKARRWNGLIEGDIDPQVREEKLAREAAQRRENTFATVAEDFIEQKVLGEKCFAQWKALGWKGRPATRPLERKGFEVARDIRRVFIKRWGKRPVAEITARDIREMAKAKKRTHSAQARNLLGIAKRLFAWAVDEDCYGLDTSPAGALKPTKIVGDKIARDRILNEAELFALWRAVKRMPYPQGTVYRLLILTALRLNEAADASVPELDRKEGIWTIPASRMKGKNSKARAHAVPLTKDILEIFDSVPEIEGRDYFFSTTLGKSPVWMSDKIKKRLDERMLFTLRALARIRGDNPKKVQLAHWRNHDIRRTVRSALSRLKIAEEVREAVLAHVPPGIKGNYNVYKYLDEKREVLEQWAMRLRSIVEPSKAANVVRLHASQ